MKVSYHTNGITFEQECTSRTQAFEFISKLREVFTGEKCQCCVRAGHPGANTRPAVRKSRDGAYTFYEMICDDCTAKLGYFQRDAMFFPSRQDKDRRPLPDNGWSVYKPNQEGGVQPDLPVNEDSRGSEVPF